MFRRNVSQKKRAVLEFRDDADAYTRQKAQPENVDHVLELQLIQWATEDILAQNEALSKNMADAVNDVFNLNVTSKTINQSKRGPFTAALNRVKKGQRPNVDDLARGGRARWLVDNGCWDRIKQETVLSYDKLEETLSSKVMTRAHSKKLEQATDAIRDLMDNIHLIN